MSCLRSRYLVLWSLETLTGHHRFYGTGLVTQNERYYHPLGIMSGVGYIAGFVLSERKLKFWYASVLMAL